MKALPVCSIQAAFVDCLLKISLSPLPSAGLDRLNTTEERTLDVYEHDTSCSFFENFIIGVSSVFFFLSFFFFYPKLQT